MNSFFLTVGSYVLTLDKSLLIDIAIQLLNTCVLCAILSFLLYKPVLKFMNARKERIAGDLKNAEITMQNANEKLKEYNDLIAEMQAKRNGIFEQYTKEANENKQLIIEEAKREANEIKARAKLQIEREQEKAKDKIRLEIIETSNLIASKVIAGALDDKEQTKLINECIKDLGDVKWEG